MDTKRAFICARQNFPRGSAGANYIQYLALAFKEIGFEPVVISEGRYELCTKKENKYEYKGIELYIPYPTNNRIIRHLAYLHIDDFYLKALRKYNANSKDVIVTYSTDEKILTSILKFANKRNISCAACIVEWFPRENFGSDKEYNKYRNAVENVIPRFDAVFPISTYIAEKYKDANCKMLVLPIMADTNEYPYIEDKSSDELNFIFPANGKMKDSMNKMLVSLGNILLNQNRKITFHITNYLMKNIEDTIQSMSPEMAVRVKNAVKCYDWLEYDQLVELYQKMDFLLIARKKDQMSMANFPSKVPEVLSYGIIPIVSKVGDYTEYYLKDGVDSIQFIGDDIKACSEAIKKATDLTDEMIHKMRVNARNTAVNRFDYHVWTEKIESVLEK